jgi:hypothetical protein
VTSQSVAVPSSPTTDTLQEHRPSQGVGATGEGTPGVHGEHSQRFRSLNDPSPTLKTQENEGPLRRGHGDPTPQHPWRTRQEPSSSLTPPPRHRAVGDTRGRAAHRAPSSPGGHSHHKGTDAGPSPGPAPPCSPEQRQPSRAGGTQPHT